MHYEWDVFIVVGDGWGIWHYCALMHT